MVTVDTFREICLSMPETFEVVHMDRQAFRTTKRIFVTCLVAEQTANFAFTPAVQAAFCNEDKDNVYPVKGGWGVQGWTTVNLRKIKKGLLVSAIQNAWYGAAPPKFQEQYRMQNRL